MKKIKKHQKFTFSLILFFIMLLLSSGIVELFLQKRIVLAKEKAQYIIKSQVSELDKALSAYMQTTDTVRILIVDNNGEINNFDKVASELYKQSNAFRSIQLAPQGNVQYVYPLKGNEDAFGDLFADPNRKSEAAYARDSGKTTLAGPFELYQSGLGIVIRQPIYLTKNNTQEFWGFSIVVLNVPDIFDSVELSYLKNLGYDYQLWRIHPDTHKKQIIMRNSKQALQDPVKSKFAVPGSSWTFSVSPHNGWYEYKEAFPLAVLLFVSSILVTFLFYAFLKINEQRKMLKELSYHDYLTNLYNGRKLSTLFKQLLQQEQAFLFLYFDIDKFKQVNDTYGHINGDKLLQQIAQRLQTILHENEYAFRIGGDEFVILYQAKDIFAIEELVAIIETDIILEDATYQPTISYGCCYIPKEATTLRKAIEVADSRMYQMKAKKQI